MSGALFETWVIGQILKSWWYAGQEVPLYFYRDKDGKELDGLLVRDGTLYPLEIKKTASPGKDDIRHFATLNRMVMLIGQGSVYAFIRKLCRFPNRCGACQPAKSDTRACERTWSVIEDFAVSTGEKHA